MAEDASAVLSDYSLPRDYGYFIGDLVEVYYRLSLPADQYLNPDSLSQAKALGDDRVEVTRTRSTQSLNGERRVYRLSVLFQIFSSAEGTQSLFIPAIPLAYGPKGSVSAHTAGLPSVPVTISPLTSPGAPFLPFLTWEWSSPSPGLIRGAGIALLITSGLFLLQVRRQGPRARSPFTAVAKKLSRERDPAAALVFFRTALNEKAGRAIFATNMEDLWRAFPRARPYEKEIRELVMLADELHFNPAHVLPGEDLLARISSVARRLRKAESWA